MSEVLQVAYEVILPIMLIAGLAALFHRKLEFDISTLSRLVFYLFMPALVFESLAQSQVPSGEISRLGLVVALLTAANLGLGWGLLWFFPGLGPQGRSAFIMSMLLVNAGNYGIPMIEFAFGSEARQYAVLIMILTTVVSYTLGIYIASSGEASIFDSAANIFRVPMIYALLAGLLLNVTNQSLPLPLERGVHLLSQAAIPTMLMMLGAQLGEIALHEQGARLRPILLAVGIRLLAVPLLVYALTSLLGVEGLIQKIAIVQLSSPTALNASMLANEFGGDSEFISASIILSTLGSIVSISLILSLL
jgi:predicted permease